MLKLLYKTKTMTDTSLISREILSPLFEETEKMKRILKDDLLIGINFLSDKNPIGIK